ncbi:MAG: DUF502 domain-containing protein [Thermoguttaceae bacterium]|nr:DUF502 domain-containing protein [Thermoguttaceae bacterium]
MSWIVTLLKRLIRYFVAGVLALLPIVITVAVIIWVAGVLHSFLGPDTAIGQVVQKLGLRILPGSPSAYLGGTLVVLCLFFIVGILVETGARSLIQRVIDLCVQKIPIVGSVYGTSKQFVAMIDKKDANATKGMKAVFCFFGKDQGTAILALLVSPHCFVIGDREYSIVIVPTAPVPVGGGLFFMPCENVQDAKISVEALMSIYVSMGITAPQFMKTVETALATTPTLVPNVNSDTMEGCG